MSRRDALDREAELSNASRSSGKISRRDSRKTAEGSGMIESPPCRWPSNPAADRSVSKRGSRASKSTGTAIVWPSCFCGRPMEEATAAFRELLPEMPGAGSGREAGTSLVRAERYELGAEFLRRAGTREAAAHLTCHRTLCHVRPGEALKVLEQTPEAERGGDYLLLRARPPGCVRPKVEAEKLLQAGLRQSSSRRRWRSKAALLLRSPDRQKEALLCRAVHYRALRNADLRLMRAIVLGSWRPIRGTVGGPRRRVAMPEWTVRIWPTAFYSKVPRESGGQAEAANGNRTQRTGSLPHVALWRAWPSQLPRSALRLRGSCGVAVLLAGRVCSMNPATAQPRSARNPRETL